MKTTTWAWVLGLGGAFTALAGYMASRAKAQPAPSPNVAHVPVTVSWPSGYTPSAADMAAVQSFADGTYVVGNTTSGAAIPSASDRVARIQQLVTDFGSYRAQNPSDQYANSFAANLMALG